MSEFEENYQGKFDNEADFTESYYHKIYNMHNVPNGLVIDWEATWDSELRHEFSEFDGHYFRD